VIPVSQRFLAAVRESHGVSVAASVFHPEDLGTPIPAAVVDGQVTMDRDARVRRQGSLEVVLEDPLTRDLLRALPYGGYATVERGVRYADGTEERVQLGRFRVEAIVWGELEGTATLTLADRMAQVQDEALTAPFAPAGLHPSEAAQQLVYAVFGDSILYHLETTPATEPVIGDAAYVDDRAAALTDLAASANAWAMFDHLGDFLLRPREPDPPPASVWTIDAGSTGALMTSQESLERSNVRNGVLVRGQPTADAPPVSALATFDDATSPLRWGGPFGRVPLISDSQSVATADQAAAVASSLLVLRLGLARTMTFRSVPNPTLEPDDVVTIVHPDGRTEDLTLNSVRIGLGVDGTLDLTATGLLASPVPLGVLLDEDAMAVAS